MNLNHHRFRSFRERVFAGGHGKGAHLGTGPGKTDRRRAPTWVLNGHPRPRLFRKLIIRVQGRAAKAQQHPNLLPRHQSPAQRHRKLNRVRTTFHQITRVTRNPFQRGHRRVIISGDRNRNITRIRNRIRRVRGAGGMADSHGLAPGVRMINIIIGRDRNRLGRTPDVGATPAESQGLALPRRASHLVHRHR